MKYDVSKNKTPVNFIVIIFAAFVISKITKNLKILKYLCIQFIGPEMFGFEKKDLHYIKSLTKFLLKNLVEIFSNIEILKMYQKSANYLISVKLSRFINL